jgi:hypothetical protein
MPPSWSFRSRVKFGDPQAKQTSSDSMPHITSPDPLLALDHCIPKSSVAMVTSRPGVTSAFTDSPGPCILTPSTLKGENILYKRPQTTVFGSSSRSASLPGTTRVGPGQYDPYVNDRPGYKWTMRGRPFDAMAMHSGPDPCAYDVVGSLIYKPKAKSLGGRIVYNDFREAIQKPGPCQYKVKYDYSSVIPTPSKFSFGIGDRFKQPEDDFM